MARRPGRAPHATGRRGKKKRLWLVANRHRWNSPGVDAKGRPRKGELIHCPGYCRQAEATGRDPWGCTRDLPAGQRLDERYPENFPPPDAGGFEHAACPFRVLAEPDPVTEAVIDLATDVRAGVLSDWPEAYPAGLVDATRRLVRSLPA